MDRGGPRRQANGASGAATGRADRAATEAPARAGRRPGTARGCRRPRMTLSPAGRRPRPRTCTATSCSGRRRRRRPDLRRHGTTDAVVHGHQRQRGRTYVYAVTAQDTASTAPSRPELTAVAEKREVQVTFTVDGAREHADLRRHLHRRRLPGLGARPDAHDAAWTTAPGPSPCRSRDGTPPVQVHPRLLGCRGEGRRLRRDPQPDDDRRLRRRRSQPIEDVVAKWRDIADCG